MNTWTIIAIVELIIFSILLAAAIRPFLILFKMRSKFWPFFIRYFLFLLIRISGSALLAAYSSNPDLNTHVLVACIALSTISLGFIGMLLVFIIRFVEVFHNPDFKKPGKSIMLDLLKPIGLIKRLIFEGDYRTPIPWEEIGEKLIYISIVLGAISFSFAVNTQVILQKISSILYTFAITIVLVALIITFFTHYQYTSYSRTLKRRLLIIGAISIVLVYVRDVAGIISSFSKRDQYGLNNFTIYEGKWQLYVFLIFLEDCLVSIVYGATPWVVVKAEIKRKNDVGQHSADPDAELIDSKPIENYQVMD